MNLVEKINLSKKEVSTKGNISRNLFKLLLLFIFMNIKPINFRINYPITIFKKNKINLQNKKQRERLFKRNIYYYLYKNKKNNLLNERWKIFLDLATRVKEYLSKKNRHTEVLSISVFGSALHSSKNDDYDFLAIVKGNKFDNIKINIKLDKKNHSVGISVKGKENFINGILDEKSSFNKELQTKIINRTSISLPYRHLAILGYDFKENKKIFVNNCYAQVYDLLINTHKTYYLKKSEKEISNKTRARKILSRLFEASKYLSIINPNKKIEKIQKEILSLKSEKKYSLRKNKELFKRFVKYYNKIVKEV